MVILQKPARTRTKKWAPIQQFFKNPEEFGSEINFQDLQPEVYAVTCKGFKKPLRLVVSGKFAKPTCTKKIKNQVASGSERNLQ